MHYNNFTIGHQRSQKCCVFYLNITRNSCPYTTLRTVCLTGIILGAEGAKEGSAPVCWSTTGIITYTRSSGQLFSKEEHLSLKKAATREMNLPFPVQVFIECAGKCLRSSVIQKYKSNPNFTVLVDSIELVRSLLDIMVEIYFILRILSIIYNIRHVSPDLYNKCVCSGHMS